MSRTQYFGSPRLRTATVVFRYKHTFPNQVVSDVRVYQRGFAAKHTIYKPPVADGLRQASIGPPTEKNGRRNS